MSSLLTGEVFAGFRVEEVLGRGGMGWVYRVHDIALDRERALKVLDPDLARDDAFRDRFQRESRMAAAIEHPAVVPVYQAGEEDDRLFIVMRLIRGPDLQKLVAAEGPLDPRRVARVVSAVAGGLDEAHRHGIIHRDVKPANILLELGSDGERVFLTDFGIGRRSEATSALTKTGQVLGTADYVAPEQIRGHGADARSDVYTLGCVISFLLTGEPPFARENQLATLYAHTNAERPRPSLLDPSLPAAIDVVVARATAIDPEQRYASAGELAAELAATVPPPTKGTLPTSAAPAAPTPATEEETTRIPPSPERRKRRVGAVLAGLAALAGLAVAAVLIFGGGDDGGGNDDGGATESGGLSKIGNVTSKKVAVGPASAIVAGKNNVLVLDEPESVLHRVEPGSYAPAGEPDRIPAPSSVAIGLESVWVSSRSEDEVFDFGPESREDPIRIDVGAAPSDIAVDEQVWVANEGDSTVSRVDPGSLEEDLTIDLSGAPSAITAGEGGVWALSGAAATIVRIDASSGDLRGRPVELDGSPVDLAFADGSVWVADAAAGELIELSRDLDPIGEPIAIGGSPIALAAGEGAVWVATRGPGRVVEVDTGPDGGRAVAEAIVRGEPTGVSVAPEDSPDPGSVWVSSEDGSVSRIRP